MCYTALSSFAPAYSDRSQLQGWRCQHAQLARALSNCSWNAKYHHTTLGKQACEGGIALVPGSFDEEPLSQAGLSGVLCPISSWSSS